jgi:hypothetical protein
MNSNMNDGALKAPQRNMNLKNPLQADVLRVHLHEGTEGHRRSRHVSGAILGELAGLRPSTREALERLSRLGVRPDHLWEETFVRRMAWIAFEADRELTAWLRADGSVAELRLAHRGHADLSAPPTSWCIHAGFGERRTLPEEKRLLLLRGDLEKAVSVGVGMGLPGSVVMGRRSPAGTGGVILYGPVRQAGLATERTAGTCHPANSLN